MMLFSPENVCMHVELGGVEYVIESSRDTLRTNVCMHVELGGVEYV